MVEKPCNPYKLPLENENNMIQTTDIEREKATHISTQKDLIFVPPAFFCFSANPQMAHLQNHTNPPKSKVLQKSHFSRMHNKLNIFIINFKMIPLWQ